MSLDQQQLAGGHARRWESFLLRVRAPLVLAGMALGLVIFYRASAQLPISALGLAIFGLCALARPDQGLLFVPLTAPLYLMPKGIWDARFGIRPEGVRFPLHEVVLLLVLGATLLHLGLVWWNRQQGTGDRGQGTRQGLLEYGPALLVLLAGTLGVLLATPEGRGEALRQWRWLIVEPLLFFGLARYWLLRRTEEPAARVWQAHVGVQLTGAFALAGAAVALIGILQYLGRDLVPLIGQRLSFVASVVEIDGVRRVTSVYGHPNNLGLFLGRVWPLGVVLAWLAFEQAGQRGSKSWPLALFWLVCALLALAGLLLTYSRGANMAALAAGAVLGWGLLRTTRGGSARWGVLLGLGLLAALLLVMFRDDPAAGSLDTRLLLWGEALRMLGDRPLGAGLGQFFFLHSPEYGYGYIAPELVGSSEQYAAHPHNLLLDVYLSVGPLGLLAFGSLVLRFVWRALAAQRGEAATERWLLLGFLAGMAAALIHGAVDNFYFVPDLAIFFWAAIALALPRRG
jgi:O-antigen ligase